jgi:CheY-like chemotaxis protein
VSRTKRFLIIDDNADVAMLLKTIVEGQNGQCEVASTTEDGIDLMKRHAYNVIISDSDLKSGWKNDGLTLLRDLATLRRNPKELAYLKDILPANASATRVLYTGDGGSYKRGDGSGYRNDDFGQERYRNARAGYSHVAGIDRVETKPGSPIKLIADLLGEPTKSGAKGW